MKRTTIVFLCLFLAAGTALALPRDPAARRAPEVMSPIHGPQRTLVESFEAAVPPAGWSLTQTNVNEAWFKDCGTYGSGYEGSCYACCLYDAAYSGPQDEWLKVDYTLQACDHCLSFYAFASPYWAIDPYQNYNLVVTIDGDEVWNYRDDNNDAVLWQWQEYVVDLCGLSAGQTIEIGFGYVGYDGAQGGFDAISFGDCPLPPPEPCCPSEHVCYVKDFNEGGCGWSAIQCGAGPLPWQWGQPTGIPTTACDNVAVTYVLGTNLTGTYPVSTGEAAVTGPFEITEDCWCLELCHYYDTEDGYDGGNVKISTDGGTTWQLVQPARGYDDILDSEYYVAECVAGEEVFCGDSGAFVRDCFDLSRFVGQNVKIGLFFGSESWPTDDLGWYVKWLKIGGDESSSVEDATWGSIKARFRK